MNSLMYQQTHHNLSPAAEQSLYNALCKSIGDALGHIKPNFRLLAPISEFYFSYFYTVPKVHKTPIGARPITRAYNRLTTRISVACNDVLAEIFKVLKKASIVDNFDSSLSIYTNTKQAIRKANLMLQTRPATDETCYFHSYDFEGMYNNLDIPTCILVITHLAKQFTHLPPHHIFYGSFKCHTKSDFNPNI
jgi:hypothetical protein